MNRLRKAAGYQIVTVVTEGFVQKAVRFCLNLC